MASLSLHGVRSWLGEYVRTSLWLVPAAMLLVGVVLAFVMLALDRGRIGALGWIFSAGPDGARATLGALATTIMTVAGVAFSITVVVLQLSSSQFSPRVVRTFLGDRLIQLVIGAYLGTFAFALLVLRTVTSKAPEYEQFVPAFSVAVAIVLALACMVLLIVFIHHVAHGVQASVIVDNIVRETRQAMNELYPDELGPEAPPEETPPPPLGDGEGFVVAAPTSGFLEYVDGTRLDRLEGIELLRIEPRVGDYVTKGDPLVVLWPETAANEVRVAKILAAFVFEKERSLRQDVGFGFRLIADVGVRALSPGINDPTTAEYCLNALSTLLTLLMRRRIPSPFRRDGPQGPLVYAPRPDAEAYLRLAFEQIAYYGRNDPRVTTAVAEHLDALARRDPRGDQAGPLERTAGMVERLLEPSSLPAADLESVRTRLQRLRRELALLRARDDRRRDEPARARPD